MGRQRNSDGGRFNMMMGDNTQRHLDHIQGEFDFPAGADAIRASLRFVCQLLEEGAKKGGTLRVGIPKDDGSFEIVRFVV